MVSRIILLFVIVVSALAAAACRGTSGDTSRHVVVASFYPLAYAVEQIAGDAVEVVNLTPPGVEPHDLELTAKQAKQIEDASLVVYFGGGFQPALEDAAARREVGTLDLLSDRDEADPHAWLDPVLFSAAARRIGEALGRRAAADTFADRLDVLDESFRMGLADCDRRVIVTAHAAFGRLAARYRLRQVALTGIEPAAEPSPAAIAKLVETVRAAGATTVFVEPLLADDLARVVAREAGVSTATLNPLEGLTKAELVGGADYFTVMRENLATLRTALGCR